MKKPKRRDYGLNDGMIDPTPVTQEEMDEALEQILKAQVTANREQRYREDMAKYNYLAGYVR